jgi:hypothetical protein
MSAIYQNEVIELTSSDLKVLEQELNQNDDFQALTIVEDEWMDKLLSRWEEPTKVQKEDMLWEESYRLESDLIESENYL